MTTTPPDSAPAGTSADRGATRVGAGILVSRLLGFVRVRLFAHYFGSGDQADAWVTALRLPNVIRNLLGEGTLSASVIPVYAEFLEEGRDEDAARFAGAALGLITTVAGAVSLLGVAAAPLLVELFDFPTWSADKKALTVDLLRIMFPMVGLFVIAAWAMAILDSHRRFFVSYVAPALWNVALIVTMLAGGIYYGLGDRPTDFAVALAWGALVGGALQLSLQLGVALRRVPGLRPALDLRVEGLREAIRNFVPVVSARGVVNLASWIEIYLAGRLAGGAMALLGYAQTFYLLPISLFGISVAAAELPELSRMRGEEKELLATRVSAASRRIAYFLIPSTIGYLVLGDVVVAALYETGQFDEAQTLVTWAVLAGFSLGLPATASSRALSSAFYALRDTRTPARFAFVRVALALVVGLALMIPLDRVGIGGWQLGAAGLALGSACGAWVEYTLLRVALTRAIGPHGAGAGRVVRMTLVSVIAAVVAVTVQLFLPPLRPELVALLCLPPFAAVYLLGTGWLGEGFSLLPSRR